jgi:hypothetical protein
MNIFELNNIISVLEKYKDLTSQISKEISSKFAKLF